ncbi:MAG: hypothetical protein BAJATHORv1_40197 [Candidatus Thorarchaeota archaeon]|nr:MAG: hypothetical protein BAJATHORv1_40197 [Candidatus Thorarchaeota archaeon]
MIIPIGVSERVFPTTDKHFFMSLYTSNTAEEKKRKIME